MNIDDLIAYAKRRGLFWNSSEIYGGISGAYDYGHIGTLIKSNFEKTWLKFFLNLYDNFYQIDPAVMMPEKVLVSSGHKAHFNDLVVICEKCKTPYRADVLLSDLGIEISEGAISEEVDATINEKNIRCPKCNGKLSNAKPFNMMFDLKLGPSGEEIGYLRPETAQGAYLNFYREFNILRKELPLGLAIIGKAYRNEIAPRQGLYRLRELLQAELQIFFDPQNPDNVINQSINREIWESRKINVVYANNESKIITVKDFIDSGIPLFYAFYLSMVDIFYREVLKYPLEKLRYHEKGEKDRAFYNKIHFDIELDIESFNGFKEVGGIHYRTDYDLTNHSRGSMQDLSVSFMDKKFIPHVLELSFGVDRNIWAMIDVFFNKEGDRNVLHLPEYIAPMLAGIFPLQKDLYIKAYDLYTSLRRKFSVFYDQSGSIGKRYARADEIGIPYCITIDYDTLNKDSPNFDTVTIRNRDTKNQERIKISEIEHFLMEHSIYKIEGNFYDGSMGRKI
ncbi:MAG: glycine--tRNA ligase [Thermoplasmata archaeon]